MIVVVRVFDDGNLKMKKYPNRWYVVSSGGCTKFSDRAGYKYTLRNVENKSIHMRLSGWKICSELDNYGVYL